MPTPGRLQHDCLDDRRQIHELLARLTPRDRITFLRWCCTRAALPHSTTRPRVSRRTVRLARLAERDESADRRLALDCFFDVWNLTTQYDFDLDAALEKLVEMVRQL
jgi:hypothetical protein